MRVQSGNFGPLGMVQGTTEEKESRSMPTLKDKQIMSAEIKDKEYLMGDGQGLSLRVRPDGTKLWLYRYTFAGARKKMSFGLYPKTTLKAARREREAAE